jgi:hypothetical protein
VIKQEARNLARKATEKSIVLLRYDNRILPVQKEYIRSVAVSIPLKAEDMRYW